jgi:hypothetical protein
LTPGNPRVCNGIQYSRGFLPCKDFGRYAPGKVQAGV